MRILWVEESPGDRGLILHCTSTLDPNCSVYFATDGKEAVELFSKTVHPRQEPPFHLAVLSLRHTDRSPFRLLTLLRRIPQFDNLKIAIFSSIDSPESRSKAYTLGAQAFVRKPIELAEFCAAISEILTVGKASHLGPQSTSTQVPPSTSTV